MQIEGRDVGGQKMARERGENEEGAVREQQKLLQTSIWILLAAVGKI